MKHLTVHIDRLVLRGLSPSDASAFSTNIASALADALRASAPADGIAPPGTRRALNIQADALTAEAIAQQIAHTILAGGKP